MCWNNEYVEVRVSTPRDVVPKLALGCLVAALSVACGPSEEDIKRDVRTRFDTNQTIAPLALSIEVKRQVVYLSGKTGTPAEQQQAMALAKEAKGVKLVEQPLPRRQSERRARPGCRGWQDSD